MRSRPLMLLLVIALVLSGFLALVRNLPAQAAAGHATVDNSQSNKAATGSILDDSKWPNVMVRVTNEHDFWLKIDVFYKLGVNYAYDNMWAKFGYIAPKAAADYTLGFHPQ